MELEIEALHEFAVYGLLTLVANAQGLFAALFAQFLIVQLHVGPSQLDTWVTQPYHSHRSVRSSS